tara:strand:- start:505 stop:639 length:135 start_codon:yes stop_codon:yes gene_type:complete
LADFRHVIGDGAVHRNPVYVKHSHLDIASIVSGRMSILVAEIEL